MNGHSDIECAMCSGGGRIEVPVRDPAGINRDGFKRKVFASCPQCIGTGFLTHEAAIYYPKENNHE